jgi:hypothetical protein
MSDEEWRRLDDHELESLLVQRWLYRGSMLGVILVAAIVATYFGMSGISGLVSQVSVGVVLAVALAAAVKAFAMRQQDLRIHRELRRRRREHANRREPLG